MSAKPVRVGIVGAGANTRLRHLPNFRAIPGVTVTAVANSTPASSAAAARELSIPKAFDSWQELVKSPDIDAVMIGTWPDQHAAVTCAALAAGKHVLCEARMARNVPEARQMMASAAARPDLVAMLVPSPFGLTIDEEVLYLLKYNYLGDLREVQVLGLDDQFQDYTKTLHWRQDREKSGNNTLTMGILHETVQRWVGPATRVMAQTKIFEPTRPEAGADAVGNVTTPEIAHVLVEFGNGARGVYHFSGMTLFAPPKQITIYGSLGTIQVVFSDKERVFAARRGDKALKELTVPTERIGGWRVEAEFIGAIRGEEQVRYTPFPVGMQYMQFTDAVIQSAAEGRAIEITA